MMLHKEDSKSETMYLKLYRCLALLQCQACNPALHLLALLSDLVHPVITSLGDLHEAQVFADQTWQVTASQHTSTF